MGACSLGQREYLAAERGWDGFEIHHVVWTKERMSTNEHSSVVIASIFSTASSCANA
jgi:hypothetical protein